MIAFTFSLFGLMPFLSFSSPAILFCLGRIRISFHLPGMLLLLVSSKMSEHRIVSSLSLPGFLGLRRLCHLSRPVMSILVFGQFFLGKWSGYRPIRTNILESVISTEISPGYCEYALTACFFGQFHLTVCVI